MEITGSTGANAHSSVRYEERRSKPRTELVCRALVRCPLDGDRRFTEESRVENISADGLYLRMQAPVSPGCQILALLFLPPGNGAENAGATIAVKATVVRAELLPNGSRGIGAQFNHYRFL